MAVRVCEPAPHVGLGQRPRGKWAQETVDGPLDAVTKQAIVKFEREHRRSLVPLLATAAILEVL